MKLMETGDENRGQRQLGCSQGEGFTGQRFVHAVHLIEHLAGLDLGDPVFRVALTVTHTDFRRFLGNRLVREDADPDPTTPFNVTRHGTTSRFDLTSREATDRKAHV